MSGQILPILAGVIGLWLMKSPLDSGGIADWVRNILSEAKVAGQPVEAVAASKTDDAIAHYRGLKNFLDAAGKKEASDLMAKSIWAHLG